jgi:hypothetical protein
MSVLRLAALALVLATPALAQYAFDPNAADEQGPGIKFFGSAKDENGALIPGVSIFVTKANVFFTDKQGRYRGNVDLGPDTAKAPIECTKVGYELVRVNKRPGPSNMKKQTIEANCVMRKK